MAHAIWRGSINFGLVAIPVKLYSAIRQHELRFNLLHGEDHGPIRYERVCSVCGKKVAWSDIVRGYEVEKGEYVVVRDEDFKKASPAATQTIDIVEFVSMGQIDPTLFDVPYYLEPERAGRHAYALLREALRRSGKVGIARVVLRTREHLAALEPNGDALVVEMMHWADEVVPPTGLDLPDGASKLPPAEMKMAGTLIDAMTAEFHPSEFHDRYRADLMALIEARAAGKAAPRAKGRPHAATRVVDLADVLAKSLEQQRARKRKKRGKHAA
jgi:DNA end-binding protein Ku